MQTTRRNVCRTAFGLGAFALLALLPRPATAHPVWRPATPRWRRARPRFRIRRRVHLRRVLGRSLWVVPVGLAAGWELLHEERLVLVRETRVLVHDGQPRELATVADADGRLHEVEILREDTPQNRLELTGSALTDEELALDARP